MSVLSCLLLILSIFHGTQPVQWTDSLPDESLKYACAGDKVQMPWNFTLSSGESVDDVQWFYHGDSGSEMIAVLTHGNFLPLPSFSHRVHFVPDAGILLDRVTVQDSGNYTVEISGHGDSGSFFRISRTVILQVGADLMTTDGELHVSENPVAVLDQRTDQWCIELHCGTFTYLGQPPFDVEWTTPSGKLLPSSTYENGQFKLLVSAPVQGGNYSCRIPVPSISTACLPAGNGASKGKATYILEQTESRLTLLEAHQAALQKENDALKAENFLLKNSDSALSDRVHQLETRTSQRVSFHARNLRNTSPQHDAPLIVDHVIINQGNCYSTSTGKFTAPFNGTYFFIGTSGSWATGQSGQFELTVEGQQISFVSTRDQGPMDAASVHGVVHLTQGDKVWLKVSSGIEFWSAATSFSGFLVSPDP